MAELDTKSEPGPWLLEVTGLKKAFGGAVALANGQFHLAPGSVHALCGGNGAGKSTFLSIIMGIHRRDAGVIKVNGKTVSFANPSEALAAGISIIEQELSPILDMTIAENIFLGREHVGAMGQVNFASMNRAAGELLAQLGFDIAPDTLMRNLTVAQVQLVEIAKALSRDAGIIIMDEPTSAVGEKEADYLFEVVKRLKAQGKGVIYVSHRLSEIFEIADAYTVFRDGQYVASGAIPDINRSELIRMIVGRELRDEFIKENTPTDKVRLEVRNLQKTGRLENISFEVRQGEILGLYGLMGAGRTEILECLFGLDHDWSGELRVEGQKLSITSARDAMKAGLAMVTEDRKETGLIMNATVRSNISLAILPALSPHLVIEGRKEAEAAATMIDRFRIKTASDQLNVSNLSGGNQQKVVMGRWHLTEPKVLLLDEPTRGVDVGAKREIYGIMSKFAAAGGSIIMVSSEADEILGMTDRIIVIKNGRIAGSLNRADADQQTLLHLAA
ncbi:MAG: sugar ABC transporter ATP-binding protein [Dongiaceae bacterium]